MLPEFNYIHKIVIKINSKIVSRTFGWASRNLISRCKTREKKKIISGVVFNFAPIRRNATSLCKGGSIYINVRGREIVWVSLCWGAVYLCIT